jgi:D-alanyl-D-alanine carboxypeptidase (penicillin-binding protein 5/6)
MSACRLVAALASILLALPATAAIPPTPAAAAPSAPVTPPVAAATRPAVQPTRPPFVPCPVTAVTHPPRPSPPVRDPKRPIVGGEGLATAGLTLPAGAPSLPHGITASSWMVADLGSGAVLGACGPHEQSPPASVQKLLLAATVMEKIDSAQVVEINQGDLAFERGSSAVGLLLGGHYSVETLWLGLLLNSGNDTANVLARLGGGAAGVPGTLQAMNAEAHHLGALDTHAVTPSGLDGPGQFTSAYDLSLIARLCFARDDFRRYDSAPTAQMPAQPPKDPRGFQIQNDNLLLTHFPGALGGKTGFTDLARHTYVGVAERNGRRLVVTLLGAEAQPLRGWQQGAALLDWGFRVPNDGSVGRLVDPGETDRALDPPAQNHAPAAGLLHARAPITASSWSPAVLASMATAAAAVPLLLVIAIRSRRTTRAGVRRRQ